MALLNGNVFRLYIGTEILETEQDVQIVYGNSLVPATINSTKGFDEVVSGNRSATISFTKLLSLEETLEIGQEVDFHIGTGALGFQGRGFIDSIEISTSSDSVASYSGSIKVTGELEDFIPIIEKHVLQTQADDNILTQAGDTICVRVQTN